MKPFACRARFVPLLSAAALVAAGCSSGSSSSSSPASSTTAPSSVSTEAPDMSGGNAQLPNVVILDGGGTITSTALGPADYIHYGGDGLSGISEVLERIRPEIDEVANLSIVDGAIPGSSASTVISQLFEMSLQLDGILASEEVDAVVVNTGTNIMEEIAYWADLTVQSDKPVVFTGSMRQANTYSFDGEANLFNAIRLAASGVTACFGTVVLMNDEFFAAREVTKTNAWATDTFSGLEFGALGVVNGYEIHTVRAPARHTLCGAPEWKTPFDLSTKKVEDLAQAEIVYSYVEASAVPIEALVAAGVDGIVTAGHGAGGISSAQSAARQAGIAEGVVFVSTTRTGTGAIYEGGDAVPGYDLTPQKARDLLQLALTFTDDPAQVKAWFDTIGKGDYSG